MKNIKKFTRNEDIISYSFNKQITKQQTMEDDIIQQTVKNDSVNNNQKDLPSKYTFFSEGIPLYGFSGKSKNNVYSQYNENSGYFIDDNKNYNYNKYNDSTGYFK